MQYNREQLVQSPVEERLAEQEFDWRLTSTMMLESGIDLTEAHEESLH